MRPLLHRVEGVLAPEDLAVLLADEPGFALLQSSCVEGSRGRYSLLVARPFLELTANGPRCTLVSAGGRVACFGSPWVLLEECMARFEILDEVDVPFPAGGCFGYWGYDLRHPLEPRMARGSVDDLEAPDCHLGFYDSVVAFDHHLGSAWIVSTGLAEDGSRDAGRAAARLEQWIRLTRQAREQPHAGALAPPSAVAGNRPGVCSDLGREGYIRAVCAAKEFIRTGHVYQVNVAHRLEAGIDVSAWEFYRALASRSPAPYAAFLHCGTFQIASASPELFLRLSGAAVTTRPIKGTRPRALEPTRDAQLGFELQTSPKDMAELVMITDLLRNDLGRVCEFGSVLVPDLVRLERFSHVQHLVSTVEGRLRPEISHVQALAACFPGGSITGAPKVRAMEIIDELEPHTRGPYTGCAGYLGFNRESQLNILIRTALIRGGRAWFHVGAGIVADSDPESEYDETMAKAAGFLATIGVAFADPGAGDGEPASHGERRLDETPGQALPWTDLAAVAPQSGARAEEGPSTTGAEPLAWSQRRPECKDSSQPPST